MSLMFLHASKKEKVLDYGLRLGGCFYKTVSSGVYTGPSLSFSHTLVLKTLHQSLNVHLNARCRRNRARVIKAVYRCSLYSFLFERAWGGVPVCRPPPSSTTTSVAPTLRLSVTLPDAGEWGMGGLHALLGTGPQKSHSMQNTSLMFCVCMCVWLRVSGWVFGCKQKAAV